MNPERWSRVQRIFSEAVEVPAAERAALLAKACGNDEELRREVEEMLAFDTGSEDILRQAIGGAVTDVVHGEHNRLIGTVIGSYRIKGVLGYGGMGTVYDAERADDHFRQRVAIKLVQQMAVHPQLRARLRAERQILANLDHPFIARLIDGGETSNGTPYLVIEYVDGKSIDEYCNENKLSVHQRLELFEKVCSAVDYAHRNLVVHRDLKPANILVTTDGTPKLLDFGIAKLLNPDPAWATVAAVTRVQDRLLTPEHASPEQVLGRTITTASDVYALGALLYELLSGRSPYALKNSTPLALERAICNEDPPRPSSLFRNARPGTKPAEDGFDPAASAALRGVGHQKLARQLSGDIDEIVLKAMRKEPEQRYATAGALADELRRHRMGEAVVARQGVRRYRIAKFVRRNALSVAMVAVVMVSLAAFASILWVQKREIAASRDQAIKQMQAARDVASFMTGIFGAADPFNTDGKEVTATQLLDAGAATLDTYVPTPETHAQMLEAIGYAYHRQDADEKAIPLLEKALTMRIENGADDLVLATNYFNLAEAQRSHGKEPTKASYNYDEALRLYVQAYDGSRQHDNVARVLTGQARLAQQNFNQLERASVLLTEALEIFRALHGRNHNEVGSTLSDLATLALWQDDLALAEEYQREALDIYKRLRAPGHPDHATAIGALGRILLMRGKLTQAEPLINDSIDFQAQAFGKNSQRVAEILETKARLREQQGRYEEAVELVKQSVAMMRALNRGSDFTVAYSEDSLGHLMMKLGRYEEAEEHAANALAIYEASLPRDHLYFASSYHLLGEALIAQKKAADAAEALNTAIAICTKQTGATSWRTARSQSALGAALDLLGQDAEAERLIMNSYRTLLADPKASQESRASAYTRAIEFLRSHGRTAEAAKLARPPKA